MQPALQTMQPTLKYFWKKSITSFPPEIVQQVVDYFAPDSPELYALRLSCSYISVLDTDTMFRSVSLPMNAEAFQRAVDVLSTTNIAGRIRSLDIFIDCFIYRTSLHASSKGGNRFELNTESSSDLITTYSRWSSSFSVRLSRLLSACSPNLRRLKITRLVKTPPSTEKAFLNCVVEVMSMVELPMLEKMIFHIRWMHTAAYLWETFYNARGTTLVKTFRALRKFTLKDVMYMGQSQRSQMEQFLSRMSDLDLKEFKLHLFHDANNTTLALFPISQMKDVTRLTLYNILVADNLTRCFERLKSLCNIRMHVVRISKDSDRWDKVFSVLMDLLPLEMVDLYWLRYTDAPLTDCYATNIGEFCSPYPVDKRTAIRLQEKLRALIAERARKCYVDWDICDHESLPIEEVDEEDEADEADEEHEN